ncbi:hypothetical protein D3C75_630500 [compost metagenome]
MRLRGIVQHVLNPVHPCYIGDFMGICDDCGYAVLKHHLGKFAGQKHGAFDMNMPVDKTRNDHLSSGINHFMAFIGTDACDDPIYNGNIPFHKLTRKHIHNGAMLHHKICRDLFTCCLNSFC